MSINRLQSNANADEQVKQLRTLFQLFQMLVYIYVLTRKKTVFYEKDTIMN